MKVFLTDKALTDVEECLDWSETLFGLPAARRDEELINVAIEDLANNGNPVGTSSYEELFPIKLYHLRHSRKRASVEGMIVKSPRHFVAYRFRNDEVLEILRLLHDSMDLEDHLLESES